MCVPRTCFAVLHALAGADRHVFMQVGQVGRLLLNPNQSLTLTLAQARTLIFSQMLHALRCAHNTLTLNTPNPNTPLLDLVVL